MKTPLLCVGHQRGNRQEVAATGSPGMEKTAPLETPGITAQHTQRHGQQCLSLCAYFVGKTNAVGELGCQLIVSFS